MLMPGRKYSADGSYRYGFNGKENDNDVKGEGNQQDYGMRIYDPRLGRFLSVDPLADSYPWFSSYQFTGNNPILLIDLDGQEGSWVNPQTGEIVPSGPILLPTGSRNQNGWVLYGGLSRPTSFKRADDFKPIAPSLTPMLQQGSDNLASVKANQSKLVVAPKKKESIETRNVQYLSADRRTDYEKQLSAQTKAQYEHAQHIGRMMQTPEGQGGMALGLFMKSTAETPISIGQNGYGVYTGLRDGDYGKAAAHTALLGLDLAPFLPFVAKGVLPLRGEQRL